MRYVDEFVRNLVAEVRLLGGRRWSTWRSARATRALRPPLGAPTNGLTGFVSAPGPAATRSTDAHRVG
jgi:hypothetical protein